MDLGRVVELADIRAFARFADFGTVSGAARTLSLSKSTVCRSLSRLEAALGAALLDRSAGQLRLTDAGLLFRPHAMRILSDIEEATIALDEFRGHPPGMLRVSAPTSVALSLVAPMTPTFIAQNQHVRLILDVDDHNPGFPVGPVDLALRVGPRPEGDSIARHLMTTEMWTCASPRYLAARGTPARVVDLENHVLISGDARSVRWSYGTADGGWEHLDVSLRSAICEPAALARALTEGAGIGRLPDFLAVEAIHRGDLVRVFPERAEDTFEIHALCAVRRRSSTDAQAFLVALEDYIASKMEIIQSA
ncbi:LysR substrate-binding domain-containing protein [Methylobacterium sp. D54C]